jgi:hypothetical protein
VSVVFASELHAASATSAAPGRTKQKKKRFMIGT